MLRVRRTAAGFLIAALVPVAGQEPVLKFEVASIRTNHEDHGFGINPELRNGRFIAQRVTIKSLIAAAFGMTEPMIFASQPLATDHFDIAAKAPEGVSDTEMKPMLQALLEERFHLVTHSELRRMRVYVLTTLNGTLKKPPDELPDHRALPMNAATFFGRPTMAELARSLSRMLERPVIDETRLNGRQPVKLVFAPPSATVEPGDFRAPDIVTALRDQAGLSIKSDERAVQVLVIDHIDRSPTEN